jgi:hypothetical protein
VLTQARADASGRSVSVTPLPPRQAPCPWGLRPKDEMTVTRMCCIWRIRLVANCLDGAAITALGSAPRRASCRFGIGCARCVKARGSSELNPARERLVSELAAIVAVEVMPTRSPVLSGARSAPMLPCGNMRGLQRSVAGSDATRTNRSRLRHEPRRRAAHTSRPDGFPTIDSPRRTKPCPSSALLASTSTATRD